MTAIDSLKKRIKATLLKERLVWLGAGLIGTAAAGVGLVILLTVLAGVAILPVWLKISLLVVTGAVVLLAFWKLTLARLLAGSAESTALKLEKKYPDLKGRLIAALQFSDENRTDGRGYSHYLIEATLVQAAEKSALLDFNQVISAWPVWKNFRALAVPVVLALALLFIFPGLFSYSYKVYSNPTDLIAPPLGYRLQNYPGETVAVKYRDLNLGGILQGGQFPDKATVFFKLAGGTWQNTKIDLADQSRTPSSFGDSVIFYTTLKQVRRSLDYYVRAGRVTTPVSHIEVVDRPRVTGIRLSLFYPEYTGLSPTVIDENDGSLSAVFGTRVGMRIETNLPVASAEMIYEDSSRSPFTIDGRAAEQSFPVERDRRYYIEVIDHQAEVNPNPIEYYITSVPDEFPVIDVVRPGTDINLNEEMMIPLLVRISDDYGFSSLVLKYSLVSGGVKGDESVAVLHFSDQIKTEGEISFNWDVEPLNLMPSDYILYRFELADNDRISGPKVTVSREFMARLPSLDEIIAQTDQEQSQTIKRAEDFLKEQRDMAERLKNIRRKIEQEQGKNDRKLAWQHQKELEEIARNDEQIAKEIQKTAQDLDKMIDRMQEDKLASLDVLEKLAEIKKLFEEVATPEMKEARLKLLEALKNMDPQQLQKSLQDYQMSQEELMERLNRTIALLKKMQIEQKVNDMTEMARRLTERQEQVNKETSEAGKKELPPLAEDEDQVGEGLDNLKQEAAKLRDMLDKVPYNKSDEADAFCKSVESCSAGENMEQMSGELRQKQKDEALDEGTQALSKMLSLLDQMQQGQASMCQGGGEEAARKMREAINDINYLGDHQEQLIDESGNIRAGSEVLRDLAARQRVLRESLTGLSGRIDELGKESPFVAAELSNLIKRCIGSADLAIDKFSNRRGHEGQTYQNEVLYGLNRAAVRMLDALEAQSNCNKGGSCNKPSQKMQSLCQKQNQLNKQTQSQCNNPGNQLKPSGADALRRLASEQNAIHKSLGQLQQEFGDNREVLGRLDAVREDMKKVADALASGEVGGETLERQLKIYSRMLDATRTMQRKDFTDQRKAAVGRDILRNSPAALTGNQLQGGLDIEDRLRQFLDEKYPEEYDQHIKAYFKALLESIDDTVIPSDNETR